MGYISETVAWYQDLRKPEWKPPDLAFPLMWTAVYAMAATAMGISITRARSPGTRLLLTALAGAGAALNVAWAVQFFGLRQPDRALTTSRMLVASVIARMIAVLPYSVRASVLLIPYLAMSLLGSRLNDAIVRMNPAGGRFPGRRGSSPVASAA
ncbi:MAG: tryptophan-rich sensory protein [Hyphomicrobiales bacterium]|nr:tryptophan-rich sensory protein [Hyphomicrobiales bacterium]